MNFVSHYRLRQRIVFYTHRRGTKGARKVTTRSFNGRQPTFTYHATVGQGGLPAIDGQNAVCEDMPHLASSLGGFVFYSFGINNE
jgi:hypothetical protein